jgi:hypothetical protein
MTQTQGKGRFTLTLGVKSPCALFAGVEGTSVGVGEDARVELSSSSLGAFAPIGSGGTGSNARE